jgi:hypothetical protein
MFRNQSAGLASPSCAVSDGNYDQQWGGMEVSSSLDPNNTLNFTDAQLASELNSLTVAEREKVLDDVHGVAKPAEETPEFVATLSKQLNQALFEVSKTKRKALNRAFFLKPSIKTDVKFNMMFLRVEQYNAKKAADRIANYFTHKLELFGEDKLVRRITLEDLDEKCMTILGSGSMLELPHPDRAGRTTMYFDLGKFEWSDSNAMVRIYSF